MRLELDAMTARLDQAIADLNQKDAEIEGAVLLVAGTVPSGAPAATATAAPTFPPGFDPAVMGEQLRGIASQMSGVLVPSRH